ncbi:MAG: NUDIX hydrolase [Eubacteriales bacterium]|nr:NUDIX hydrolase [Eubacteriales bacterium]
MEVEYVDIYTKDREKTGRSVPRKNRKLREDEYMLYVLALVENQENKFLLTRRAKDKHWAAGWWEIPGGGASAGESSFQAVSRELREETGLDVSDLKRPCCYTYRNDDPENGDNYFVDLYYFRIPFTGKDLNLQEEEVTGARLVPESDFEALSKRDGFLHYERVLEALSVLRKSGVRK